MSRAVDKLLKELIMDDRAEHIRALMDNLFVSEEDAMRILRIPEEEREAYHKLLKKTV